MASWARQLKNALDLTLPGTGTGSFERQAVLKLLPKTVTDLVAAKVSTSSASLTFTPSVDATTHQQRKKLHSVSTWDAAATVLEGATLTGLTISATYDFQVRGVNSYGVNEWSNVSTVALA